MGAEAAGFGAALADAAGAAEAFGAADAEAAGAAGAAEGAGAAAALAESGAIGAADAGAAAALGAPASVSTILPSPASVGGDFASLQARRARQERVTRMVVFMPTWFASKS